jgi:hypothetical protein
MNLPLPAQLIFLKSFPAGECVGEKAAEGRRSLRPVGYFHGSLLCAKRLGVRQPSGALAREMTEMKIPGVAGFQFPLFPGGKRALLCLKNSHHDAGRS